MSSDMTYGPVKPLSKLSKNALIHLATDRLQQIINLKQDADQTKDAYDTLVNELNVEFNEVKKFADNYEKDLSITQSCLNDVEEKNRALNVQLLDLRKALKTMSQFL